MATETEKKPRKSPARNAQIVLAAVEERVLMIERAMNIEDVAAHAARVRELFDELRRAIGKKEIDE